MQTYDYRPNAGKMLLAIAFFGVCAAWGYAESTKGHAILIDGLIYLGPDRAKLFWWAIAGVGLGFVALGLAALVQALMGGQRLHVGDESLEMPKSPFGSAMVTIPYRDISSISLLTVRNYRFLQLKTAKKTYNISEAKLTRETFEAVAKTIAAGQERARDAMFKGMAASPKPEQPQTAARPATPDGPRPFGRR
jgi:hypothetical protein